MMGEMALQHIKSGNNTFMFLAFFLLLRVYKSIYVKCCLLPEEYGSVASTPDSTPPCTDGKVTPLMNSVTRYLKALL